MILDWGDIYVRAADISDVIAMKDNLRESDIREVEASHGFTPEQALRQAFEVSEFRATIVSKGVPVVLFGVMPDGTNGSVWMLATKDLKKIRLAFLKISRLMIAHMLELYPYLYNYADVRNEESIEWLKWCGATFLDPIPYGKDQRPFQYFSLNRSDYVQSSNGGDVRLAGSRRVLPG